MQDYRTNLWGRIILLHMLRMGFHVHVIYFVPIFTYGYLYIRKEPPAAWSLFARTANTTGSIVRASSVARCVSITHNTNGNTAPTPDPEYKDKLKVATARIHAWAHISCRRATRVWLLLVSSLLSSLYVYFLSHSRFESLNRWFVRTNRFKDCRGV